MINSINRLSGVSRPIELGTFNLSLLERLVSINTRPLSHLPSPLSHSQAIRYELLYSKVNTLWLFQQVMSPDSSIAVHTSLRENDTSKVYSNPIYRLQGHS